MKKFITILICVVSVNLYAQKTQADLKFNLYEYTEAIPLYKMYLGKNPNDYAATLNLSLCYKYTNDIDKAIMSYKTVTSLIEAKPKDYFDLIQLLRIKGNLAEAKEYTLKLESIDNNELSKNILLSINEYEKFIAPINDYVIANKTANYEQSVFAGMVYKNGLLVTAASMNKGKSEWTGNGFTKLYTTDVNFTELTPFAPEIMTDRDDGNATISNDGTVMYITSVNEKLLKEKDVNTRKLQITSAQFIDGKWKKTNYFTYNNENYNIAHPVLSTDGKMLLFSSDKPGGKGGMDIYFCLSMGNNNWSEPMNAFILNTSENEIFPSVDGKGNIYFASDGLPGLGGLDLFKTSFDGTSFADPVNINAPLNSSYDDFYVSTDDNLESGFISSNRFGNPQSDDIFSFVKKGKQEPEAAKNKIIKIHVLDKFTSIPLPYVSVTIKDSKNNIIQKGMTGPDGVLIADELPQDDYQIQGTLNDITTTIAKISRDEFSKPLIEKTILHNDPRFTLTGIVINADNAKPVSGVSVFCTNNTYNKKDSVITADDGKFFFQLEQESDFIVQGRKDGFFTTSASATTKGLVRSENLYVQIQLNIEKIVIGKEIVLENIYYDLDKSNIRADAAIELDKLVKILNDNPQINIELGSHTDSRGSDAYNLKLSQRRAESAVGYIISRGIDAKRISAKGYGETKLTNQCANGITCTEEDHQKNRRTEFKVLSIN